MKVIIQSFLCIFGIHTWKYSEKPIELTRLDRKIIVEVPFRKCKICNKRMIRTMLPRVNGVDFNKWRNI